MTQWMTQNEVPALVLDIDKPCCILARTCYELTATVMHRMEWNRLCQKIGPTKKLEHAHWTATIISFEEQVRSKIVGNSILLSIGYEKSGKIKLEISTEVHYSRDHHFKRNAHFTSCIYDESVIRWYIQYFSISADSSLLYVYSQWGGVTKYGIGRNMRYPGIGGTRFNTLSTFFSAVDY